MSIFGLKSQNFLQKGLLGGAFFENFEPPQTQGLQKNFGWPHKALGPHIGHACSIQ
jgi:hypothetical protein